ncbi:septal ring lytic transglycosylase RlpA family protein [Marivirga sp. S37H4]|uniref:Probable endolytic peptidoglycan transglycosylase RlpA n=1 Tax=Marivirga aurantiaca TaxID=2802615 RepID=A0A935CDL4_9BACT|nr:septal ring lytic transglycosylase RlpA family protein [Marivirga aurantiaca]MBK6267043.1 septal ring lytic transglycosylase RlpA family protein [Marivirga aurantiaca]
MNKIILQSIILLLIVTFSAQAQKQTGIASYYADKFDGKSTASGEKYNHKKLTAAHKFLPFGTMVKVTNLANGKFVEVRINDRGPFVEGRVIDLSREAAEKLKFTSQGLTEVEIEVTDAGDGKSGSNRVLEVDHPVDIRSFFAVDVEKENPKGWGVQVGSFEGFDNMLRLAENLEKSYSTKVLVEVRDLQDKKAYAIILGQYKNRKKADNLKEKIADRFPGAFVVKY